MKTPSTLKNAKKAGSQKLGKQKQPAKPKRKRPRKPNPNRKIHGTPILSCWIRDSATLEQITALVNSGARISAQDSCGNQPLHYAASAGDVLDVVEFLVDRGANVLARNTTKKTPLDVALQSKAGADTISFLEAAEQAAKDLKSLK